MKVETELGKMIRERRQELQLSQRQLAYMSGVSNTEIKRIEDGSRKQPGQDILTHLSIPLRIDKYELFTAAGYIVTTDPFDENSLWVHRKPTEKRPVKKPLPPHQEHLARGEEAYPARPMRVPTMLPLIGEVPAGPAELAAEYVEDYLPVDPQLVADDPNGYYWLRIKGKSMSMDGITDKGKILVHRQEDVDDYQVAVVRIDNTEATVKRVKHLNGKLQLIPAHPSMEVMELPAERVRIIGRVKLAQTEF
jgi:SOS-response transcriptional repressor LexA